MATNCVPTKIGGAIKIFSQEMVNGYNNMLIPSFSNLN